MQLHTRSERTVMRRLTALATAVLVGIVAVPFSSHAQTSPFQAIVPCYVPPSPATDSWPVAGEDTLGPTAGMPVTFASAALLANDSGASIAMSNIDRVSYGGGQISGSGPYTYTPAVGFIGTDSFAYEISDGSAQTAIGVISVVVTADVTAPTVSIDAPVNGAVVSSNVPLTATASDTVGVAGVTFLDGGAPIGAEVLTAPFQATWQTGLVSDGLHTLTAIARDAAGNTATSAPVSVTVRNLATVPAIIGMTQAGAQAAIVAAGLTVGTVSSANSAAPAGQVIGQSPGVGASVAPNSAVSFTVSLGPALVTVPNVVGSLQPAAQAAITGAGLTVGGVTTANSAAVPAGAVISQTPIGGATVAPSSAVALVVSSGPAATAVPTVEKMVFSEGLGKRTTAAFSTAAGGDVLVAFAASDGPAAPNAQTLTIAGAGLTWTRRARANTQFGVAEIWTAPAPNALSSVTVSSTQATAGLHQSLTVIAFTGVAGVGAANIAGGIGAPSIGLTTTAAGSAVYAVGNDWDRAVARTLPAGQTKVHEFVDTAVGDTFWVQALNATAGAAGSVVTLNATAPTTDQYNLAIVELTPGAAPAPVSVPNVVGLTQAAAQSAITAAGLSVGAITTANSASVPAGLVISESPAASTSVAPNSAVAIVVSLGPAPATVAVPNVVGLTQAAAQNAITAAGLSLGAVTPATSASVPAGQVVSQTPGAGANVVIGSAIALVVSSGPALGGPTVDANVFSNGTGTRTTPAFSTTAAGDVLVAFAASDGPTTGTNTQTLTISGAGLAWTRVARAATSRGVSEIWAAPAPAALSNVTVSSAQSVTLVNGAAVNQLLNVVAFSNATGIGASNIAAAASGAPAVSLVAQAAGSVVYAVGNDFDQAIARSVPAGQTKVREFLAPTGDTFWVQAVNAATAAAGATVTINDTAPTGDQWNFAIVEVKR
jgi:beta-lactam-binding protein with PASTA domain